MVDAACVLVVDDDWMNRELLEAYLRSAGYCVSLANNGEKALEMAFADPPQLIMLDVRLGGIDGFEVCRRLRRDLRTARVPVLLLSALHGDDEQRQAEAAGADGFVAKPIKPAALLAQVAALIGDASH